MDRLQCENYFSAKRFDRYLHAVEGDYHRAYLLYKQHERFSGHMYALLACFEVILRNQINSYMTEHYSPNWLIELSRSGSVFDRQNLNLTFRSLVEVREALEKVNKLNNDDMVGGAYFGIWTSIFQRKQLRALNQLPLLAFRNAPELMGLTDIIRNNLNQCRHMRNLVAHLEPLIFSKDSSKLSFKQVDRTIKNVVELSQWLGVGREIYEMNLREIESSKTAIQELIHHR